MRPIRSFSVIPRLPPKLEVLWDLAYNYWFCWNDGVSDLFAQIDLDIWRECHGNPVAFLNQLPQKILEELARDEFFVERVRDAKKNLDDYLARTVSPVPFPGHEGRTPAVAYFSAEFGIDASLPVYSGGLGILAGDHLKSASDLNVPLVAIGLAYKKGYFRQYLTPDGWQQERYPDSDFEQLPMSLVKNDDGDPLTISVDMAGRECRAQVWKVAVGRISLLLLDANIADNDPDLREVTAQLYGGDWEMRIRQEILLGIGGIRALWAMGLAPTVIHMNEGHSAFAGLERIRVFMSESKLAFEAAVELTASTSVFTTHTPVPAGNDRFDPGLMQKYFEGYAKSLGLAFKVFLALGREDPRNDAETFCMTVLALRLSRFNNGVSELHGKVSRNMWKRVWPQYPVDDVPISAITNGVHQPSFVAPDMAALYDRYLGINWKEDPDCARVWRQAQNIPDSELWRTHERLRERLVDYARHRVADTQRKRGARRREVEESLEILDPRALTICFARRFATYKRANLLFMDVERLKRLVGNPDKPVQFIFAGKAHPQDNEGKKLIQQIIQLSRTPELKNKIVFLEDYDMSVARFMVQGGDVWLNNPRVPLEACGTSGMKAMSNGVLNVSTLDGWWAEAYQPDNSVGYGIGQGEIYDDWDYQDFVESQTLYNVLENDVVPDFYDRGHGNMPRGWVRRMKNALVHLGAAFSAHRMVEDYVRNAYIPAFKNYRELAARDFAKAKQMASWRMDVMTKWGDIHIRNVRTESPTQVFVGEPFLIEAEVWLAGLPVDDVRVELYAGPINQDGDVDRRRTIAMSPDGETEDGWKIFKGELLPQEAGRFGFTIRILPFHPLLIDPRSLGLIRWVG
ncbi:alpha-glucan phosphorylase [Alkalidesulfovibrio alkalitolerans DSM 16529]|jgi:starch phosphorylase|uniref:Alpha-glucan phosphorylase n=1 Tax=Alkalidesulfovibrio alkalitolerans DSM 16529 TaxID=1121439 RepID=S7UL77_9BACT|nr:alpha-glucan family phosphorylase [Alkalidesulfovibrio alkalitolerans]EPR34614.1 alpha-glucan phosphorylase [Alkalidesulfovibrio alkalitolerans DSM 16529]